MRPQDPVKIARIGLVLEMADGSKVMVYADQLDHAEAVIRQEEREPRTWLDASRHYSRPPETSITITGLESYRLVYADPTPKATPPGRMLEAIRREVRS